MHGRVFAYLMCREAPSICFEDLLREMTALFPAFARTVEPIDLPGLDESGFAAMIAGVPVSFIVVPAPLPRGEWEEGARTNPAWPEAAEVASTLRAHVVVAPLGEAAERHEALRKAMACTIAAAALVTPSRARGLCWYPAQTLTEAAGFVEMASEMVRGTEVGPLPLDSWIRLEFGRMDGRYVAIGRGLVPLIGYDLMAIADQPDPAAQGGVVYNVAAYLIGEMKSLAEGDTMDVGPQKFVARHAKDTPLVRLEPMRRVI